MSLDIKIQLEYRSGVRMRLHIWRMDGIGIRSGTRVARRLETG